MASPVKYRIEVGAASMSYDIRTGRHTVATVWSGDKEPSYEKALANARLIAAALNEEKL